MNKKQNTWIWVVGILLVVLLMVRIFLPYIFAWDRFEYPHMFSPMMFPIGVVGMVIFWGFVIYLVYKLLIQDRKYLKETDDLDILRRRLSNGEITIEEYEKIKKTLKEEK